MQIIQGDNKPIILEFDEDISGITSLSAILYDGNDTELLQWNLDTAVITDSNTITLPLTQEQTIALPNAVVKLDLKWIIDSNISFADVLKIYVAKRLNKTLLTESEV